MFVFETPNDIPYISMYLFKIKIFRKVYKLKKGKHNGINALRVVNTNNVETNICYGFSDPFETGLLYGALSIFSNIIQFPDFLPQHDYINIYGRGDVFLWTTIKNYIKFKRKSEVS